MTRAATFIIAAIALVCSTAAAAQQEIKCESPCECSSAHGKGRWAVKNDPSTPPVDASSIQAVTPSDVFSWPGPAEHAFQIGLKSYMRLSEPLLESYRSRHPTVQRCLTHRRAD